MSPLKDRIPVEPLDDERWTRLERGVVGAVRAARIDALADGADDAAARARRDAIGARGGAAPRGRALAWGAAGLAAAAALAVIAWQAPWRGARGPGGAGGPDETVAARGDLAAATAPLAITTDGRGTELRIDDARVAAGPETSFTIARPPGGAARGGADRGAGGVELSLARGTVSLDVPHRPDRAPLVVHAGDVDVIDVGTVFSVTRGDDVTVDVREGEVQVARAGAVTRVAAGERWSASQLARADRAGGPGAGGGAAAGSSSGGGAIAAADRHGAGADGATPGASRRDPSSVAAGAGPVIPIGGPADLLGKGHVATAPGRAGAAAAGGVTAGASPGGAPHATHAHPAAPADAAPVGDLHAQILAEAIAPAAALAPGETYVDWIAHGDDHARAGLYGLAHAAFAAGHLDDAVRWLDRYRTRFPDDATAEPVLWLRVRIRCHAAIDDACRAAAQTYLTAFPTGDRSRLVERITVTR